MKVTSHNEQKCWINGLFTMRVRIRQHQHESVTKETEMKEKTEQVKSFVLFLEIIILSQIKCSSVAELGTYTSMRNITKIFHNPMKILKQRRLCKNSRTFSPENNNFTFTLLVIPSQTYQEQTSNQELNSNFIYMLHYLEKDEMSSL